MIQSRRTQAGMTLIELMISVSIMTVITFGAYQVLSNLQLSHERMQAKTSQLDAVQRFWYLLKEDTLFTTARAVRVGLDDRFGASSEENFEKFGQAFAGQAGMFQLSRTAGLPRLGEAIPQSELRRVAYALESDKLYRFQWTQMDAVADELPLAQLLLEGVKVVAFRYGYSTEPENALGEQNFSTGAGNTQSPGVNAPKSWAWTTIWPSTLESEDLTLAQQLPLESQQLQQQGAVPSLLEVTLEVDGIGTMKRLFQLGAPDAQAWEQMRANTLDPDQDQNQQNPQEEQEGEGQEQEALPGPEASINSSISSDDEEG